MEWLNSIHMALVDGPIAIKRCANRRLFNTETGTSVTLEDRAGVAGDTAELAVFDAAAGANRTCSVLRPIIREHARHG